MKVAIITSGYFPVSASKGGAVETLDDYLIEKNEKYKEMEFNIISIYDEKALEISKKYNYSKFEFVKTPKIIEIFDLLIYKACKDILKKEKHMSYRYIVQRLYFINEVSKILKRNDFDRIVIENHSTLFMALKTRNNYKKYKDKYYYHLHNVVTNAYGCKEIIQNCKKVLGVSNYINKTLVDFLGGIKKDKLRILKNCVDTERFNINFEQQNIYNMKNKYGIKDDEKIIVFTGRLNKEKGVKELLEAFKKIQYKKVKLMIVGSYFFDSKMSSDFENELKNIANEIKERIVFTGFVQYSEISLIYAMADIAVIPSIWDDPAPLTVIESMASGLPLITTYSGGIPEYANNNCAIILKRDENIIDNIASAMDSLLADKERCNSMAKASRLSVEKLNPDNFYSNFVKELRD